MYFFAIGTNMPWPVVSVRNKQFDAMAAARAKKHG